MNLKNWGFTSYDKSVFESLSESLQNFANKKIKQMQRGGRVTLPQEYFGINSGKYLEAAPGPSLTVTDDFIRPPADASDPTGVITGGGRRFEVSQIAINKATSEMKLSGVQKKELKREFENKVSELLHAVAKKNRASSHLSEEGFERVWGQKKYSALH